MKMQIKKGFICAACSLTSGMLLHTQPLGPFLTWMLFALRNSIVCPSPSC